MTDQTKAREGSERLVAKAFSSSPQQDLANAVSQLSPREAEMFLHKLEAALRKRKIKLLGYLIALVVWVIAMAAALVYFGMASGFVGWVLLVPVALVGVILWAFGAWADRASQADSPPVAPHRANTRRSYPDSGAQ